MGFNIATARLGNRTEVRTTRAGDAHWVVTEIDFREMQRRESFQVPLRREAKDDPAVHGTEIVVHELNPKMLESLRRPPTVSNIRQRLGRVYSYLLRSSSPIPEVPDQTLGGKGIALYLNSKRLKPWIPCVWSAQRGVSRSGAEIKATGSGSTTWKSAWSAGLSSLSCGPGRSMAGSASSGTWTQRSTGSISCDMVARFL
jgi:hypothetical protein